MKGNLTVIIRDNDKNEDVVFYADSVHYNVQNGESVRILAYMADPEKDDEKTEEIADCRYGHSFVAVTSFTPTFLFCEKCGFGKDEV